MKKTLLALVLALSFPAQASLPDQSRMLSYFEGIEGHWEGKGTVDSLNSDGSLTHLTYDADIQVDRSTDGDGVWSALNHVVDQNGNSSQATIVYTANGDTLLISSNGGASEAVQVIKTDDRNLDYQVERIDAIYGRRYVFFYHTEVDLTGKHMLGHNELRNNGVVISTENFDLLRD